VRRESKIFGTGPAVRGLIPYAPERSENELFVPHETRSRTLIIVKPPFADQDVPVAPATPGPAEGASPRAGFAAVVEDHWGGVVRFLLAMTGNHHDTEELTQETFLRALRRIESFQPGTRIRNWLLRIAANTCMDRWRKQKPSRWAALADDPPGPANDPSRRLETLEEARLLQAAVERLSETTRAVFHLRAQESLPFRQIGEMLGLSEEAARWHMHQARSKLLARAERG